MSDSTASSGAGASPALIMQLALAHRSSAMLFAASTSGVFTALAGGPKTAAAIAGDCGASPEPMRLLLEGCVSLGLLTSDGATFSNTPTASAFLVRGGPAYIGDGLKYAEDLYPVWGGLAALVKSGKPVMPPEEILGQDKAKTRAFVLAMHERAKGISSVLPHGVDIAGKTRLLDVGGGPGTYSIALVKQTPGLSSTVLDRPGVLEVTKEIVADANCADRITLLPGDYLTTPFGSGYDVVLLSGMMHRETPDDVRLLLRKTFDALDPGGLIIVSDVFFDTDAKNSPPFAIHFAINMMLTSDHGSAHAKTEMASWMAGTGFTGVDVRPLPPPNPHTLVLATKPRG
jgi:predicted O-methyltransferase YrrM